MRWLVPVVAATSVGTAAGVLLGLYVRLPGNVAILAFGSVGLAAIITLSVTGWWLQDRSRELRERSDRLRLGQERSGAHARRLNQDVFLYLPDVAFAELTSFEPERLHPAAALATGGGVASTGLDHLPGWSCALNHMRADDELGPAWEELASRAGDRIAAQVEVHETVRDRLSAELLQEYGFETRLDGGRFAPAPWCDVSSLATLALRNPDAGAWGDFAELPPRAHAAEPGPYSLLAGTVEILRARSREGADPHRLHRLVTQVLEEPGVRRAITRARHAEGRGTEALEEFRRTARRFRDRVSAEGSVPGTCSACRPWQVAIEPLTESSGAIA